MIDRKRIQHYWKFRMFKERKSRATALKWLLPMLALGFVTTSAKAFDVSIKAGSIHIAQQRDEQSSTPPDMQTAMINADGEVDYYLRANRDALFKVNFIVSEPGVELARLGAWLTVFNDSNAATGQSFELTGPSGASPILELPITWDHANAPHRYEDSHSVIIPGSVVQSGLRWVLNWYVYDDQRSPNDEQGANGLYPILATNLIETKEIAVSLFDAYTPEPADWSLFYTAPFEGTQNTSHDPDGVHGVDWSTEIWDGTTTYNPTQLSKADFYNAMCPNGRIRGLRDVFYQHNPFSDTEKPTKGEVDEWHRLLINHVRTLVGYSMPEYEIKKDNCLFARAQWGDERKFTTQWDAKYPGVIDSAAGPCTGGTNSYCGASFMLSAEEQAPYLPAGHAACGRPPGSEGIFGAGANKPWSIKMSTSFCSNLSHEGFWGGHTGPWFHREKFGFSFWSNSLRAKWSGNSYVNPYPAP